MATPLSFTEEKGLYVARFTSQGSTVIEIEREKDGLVSVLANIEEMRPVPIAQYNNGYNADAIFRINIPAGIEVVIKSATEVINAKMIIE